MTGKSMNDLAAQGSKCMTVREVAEVLGVTPEAIKWHVRKLYPESIRNGIETTLTEVQITEIKKKMIPTSQLVGAISDLEAADMLLKSAEHFKARFEQERRRRIEAENKLSITEPKAETLDRITAGETDLTIRELAAVLAVPRLSGKALLSRMREDGYIGRDNIPRREYIDRGILGIKYGLDGKARLTISAKGLAHFAMKYGVCKVRNFDVLKSCTGYRIGKHGGFWLTDIAGGRAVYTREQKGAPELCRACVKIIAGTLRCFYPENYMFLNLLRNAV
jgi:phage antirepressor YoqD-like protein